MAGKTILILGGGEGGLVAARRLRERLGREHRIILEPDPVVALEQPSRHSHLSKVAFERYWLWRWFGGGLPGVQALTDRVMFGPAMPPDNL